MDSRSYYYWHPSPLHNQLSSDHHYGGLPPATKMEESPSCSSIGSVESLSARSSSSFASYNSFDSGYGPSPHPDEYSFLPSNYNDAFFDHSFGDEPDTGTGPLAAFGGPPKSTKVRPRASRQFKCRHHECTSPAFPRMTERNDHELACGGYVCTGRRRALFRSKNSNETKKSKRRETSAIAEGSSGQSQSARVDESIPDSAKSGVADFWSALVEVLDGVHASKTDTVASDSNLSASHALLDPGTSLSSPFPQIPGDISSDNQSSGGGMTDAGVQERLPEQSPPSDSTDDTITLNSSPSSIDLTISTSMSSERKKKIIEKVMETFDDIYLRSPRSWYSDCFDEEEGDTDYGSDQASTIQDSADEGGALQENDGSSAAGPTEGCGSSTQRASDKPVPKQEPTAGRKRTIDESDPPGDDDGDEEQEGRKRQRTPSPEKPSRLPGGRKFACPYARRYPNRAPKASACVFPGFPNIARLKGHLYRTHMRPQLCLRCYRTFQSERSLAEHQNETERCAQVLNIPEIEGITPEQETQLKSKKRIKGEDSEERKWECVYLILFPGETEIPSPYCDFDPQVQYSQMSPGSANLMAFEQFSRENLRAIVQRRLEAQIETEEVIVEERLRGMMYDIMRMAQEDMLNQWRSSLHTVGRNSESRDVSETQSNPTNPPVTNNQDSTEGNIADLVVPPPSTDHVDAREALAEARVDKPRVADSGFFSFDTSSNTTEQPESRQSSSRDFLLSSQTSAPPDQSDQPSPTVADGSPPAEGLDNTVDDCPRNQANLSLSRSERDASAPTSATATSIDDLFGIGGAVPLDTDSHLFDSFGESFWDFSYPLDQQG